VQSSGSYLSAQVMPRFKGAHSDGPIGGNSALPNPWWLLLGMSIPVLIEHESNKSDRDQGSSRDDQPMWILQGEKPFYHSSLLPVSAIILHMNI
jgi:hypothetical protein